MGINLFNHLYYLEISPARERPEWQPLKDRPHRTTGGFYYYSRRLGWWCLAVRLRIKGKPTRKPSARAIAKADACRAEARAKAAAAHARANGGIA